MSQTFVNETAGIIAAFDSCGKTWQFHGLTPQIRAAFSMWCELRDRRAISKRKPHLDREEYQDEMNAFASRKSQGWYEWGSPLDANDVDEGGRSMGQGVVDALKCLEGNLVYAQILLDQKHKGVTLEEVTAIAQTSKEEFEDALRASFGLAPKNLPSPELSPGTSPKSQGHSQDNAA